MFANIKYSSQNVWIQCDCNQGLLLLDFLFLLLTIYYITQLISCMRVSIWHNMHLPYMYIFEYDSLLFYGIHLKDKPHTSTLSGRVPTLIYYPIIRFIALVKHALYITTWVDVILVGQYRSIPLLLNVNLSFKTCGCIVVRKVTISRQIW